MKVQVFIYVFNYLLGASEGSPPALQVVSQSAAIKAKATNDIESAYILYNIRYNMSSPLLRCSLLGLGFSKYITIQQKFPIIAVQKNKYIGIGRYKGDILSFFILKSFHFPCENKLDIKCTGVDAALYSPHTHTHKHTAYCVSKTKKVIGTGECVYKRNEELFNRTGNV